MDNFNDYAFSEVKKMKEKKEHNFLKVIIIVLVILSICLFVLIVYLQSKVLKISINNDSKLGKQVEELLDISQDKQKIYIPIKEIASFLGYTAYNGDYIELSEDSNKCHVRCEEEATVFEKGSNIIYKIRINNTSDYENIKLQEPVIEKEGKLYTTIEGIEKAFNVSFKYDVSKNSIQILTMKYLVEAWQKELVETQKLYKDVSLDFDNQKAMLKDMIIVENENGKLGVYDVKEKKMILDIKYDSITYLPYTNDFLVSSNLKYGIISAEQETIVKLDYDSIKLMNNEYGLYKVEKDEKVGVIDTKGNTIIYVEYDEIGIDASNFSVNDVQTGNILLNKLIPVKKDKTWGFFTIDGKQAIDFKYEQLGYISKSTDKNTYSALVIEEYKVIIVGMGEKYNLITEEGEEIFPNYVFDGIYMRTENGQINYYISYNGGKTINAAKALEMQGYYKETN